MKVNYETLRGHYIKEFAICKKELRSSYFIGFLKSINESENLNNSQKVRMIHELIEAYEFASKS